MIMRPVVPTLATAPTKNQLLGQFLAASSERRASTSRRKWRLGSRLGRVENATYCRNRLSSGRGRGVRRRFAMRIPSLPRKGGRAMPAAKAPSIQLSPDHERELKELVRAHSTPQKLAERARIILLASDGRGVSETAEALGIWRKTAGHWRRRWLAAEASAGVAERLSDAPRCGAPATFTPEQICQIMALACEDPERLDVPISQWSQSELARQAVSRGIVKSISHGSVGRVLIEGDIGESLALYPALERIDRTAASTRSGPRRP